MHTSHSGWLCPKTYACLHDGVSCDLRMWLPPNGQHAGCRDQRNGDDVPDMHGCTGPTCCRNRVFVLWGAWVGWPDGLHSSRRLSGLGIPYVDMDV